ncbi:plasmid mobilization protein [uncultured Eubacterium sp.]|uniref:plasmid mobilization protein n=1 Tax=uncultured Eubacterium sp. TaxID=165185 RepID=UPI0025F12A83|nr:hypothetical protein [uncultured Eubacterium sp.]
MSAKNVDGKGRLRSKIVSFRMSTEEANLLDGFVLISGINKQDYLINRALQRDVIINYSPRLEVGIKKELIALCNELKRVNELTEDKNVLISEILRRIEK